MSDADPFKFIYGDDYGEIATEELGIHQGTTTRQMTIPDTLARSLYQQLDEHFQDTEEKYVVYGSEGYHIANVCIVEATDEDAAIEKARYNVGYLGARPRAMKIEDHPEHGDVWAAVV